MTKADGLKLAQRFAGVNVVFDDDAQ
jgi:hypothetical protein